MARGLDFDGLGISHHGTVTLGPSVSTLRSVDLTAAATPGYFATMGVEAAYLRKRAERLGPSAADYTRDDTFASLSMGVLSLLAPMVLPKLLGPFVPGKGKLGKALLATAVGSVAVTTVADAFARRAERATEVRSGGRRGRRDAARRARQVARAGGVAAVVDGRDRDHDRAPNLRHSGAHVEAAGRA